jgi:hypothetical protein
MKPILLLATILAAVLAPSISGQTPKGNDAFAGNWTLDPDNSTFDPGPGPMERHMLFEMKDGALKHVTRTPTLFAGTNMIEYTARFDGKDYEILGSGLDSVSLKRLDANTIERTGKESGKVAENCTMKISADGKTLTVTTKGAFRGTEYSSVQVYTRDK